MGSNTMPAVATFAVSGESFGVTTDLRALLHVST